MTAASTKAPVRGVGPGFIYRRFKASLFPRPGAAIRVPFDPAALSWEPAVTWIGHASVLVRLDGVNVLADPMFSQRASPVRFAGPRRQVAPGVPLDALPPVAATVVSHDHYDHADLSTWRVLAARGTRFVVPRGMGELVRGAGGDAVELSWWESAELAGLRVHCVPAQHFSGRTLTDRNRRLWAGFVVERGGRRVYHAGDTGYFAGFAEIAQRLGPIDLAILPIGAYLPREIMARVHMDPEEAVQAALDLDARAVMGMHFGTFDLTDEPLDEPPARFLRAAAQRGLEGRAFVLDVGETRRLAGCP
jgi:N-acyl-phosphatidylethanolamine-hydrolysing phospholipase D